MKVLLIIILSAISVFSYEQYELDCNIDLMELSEKIALNEEGVKESGKNKGEVCKYLKSVELSCGYAYCAAGQYWSFAFSCEELNLQKELIPLPKTGLANLVFIHFKKNGKKVKFEPKRHSFLIWRKGKSYFGHIERIISVQKAGWVKTIAFNVKFQRQGKTIEGVAIKQRNVLYPLNRMQLRGIASLKGV